MLVTYVLLGRSAGAPKAGLKPTWVFFQKLSDGSAVTPPAVAEIGHGQYKFSYDPEASGEASGQIDFGSTITAPADRYVDVASYLSDSRTMTSLDVASLAANLLGAIGTKVAAVFAPPTPPAP